MSKIVQKQEFFKISNSDEDQEDQEDQEDYEAGFSSLNNEL